MKMVVENNIGMEAQPLLLPAEGESGSDNVQISGAGEDGQPAHDGAGDEMGGF